MTEEIGKVTVTFKGKARTSPVMCHPTYGITCWEIGTTNGYLSIVADRLQQRGQDSAFALELGGKPWDFGTGRMALFDELVKVWIASSSINLTIKTPH